ncbi:2-succinyl-6-hydroxy-2,4-cyclohexadiene-1-carboxylate synthase [Ectobacillus ponti]|uniref:Putative 2-succinyl-6-hydroxy-2,4-cyclohexadiene-1-carboxylate synthase n=1 Tax=Ectobacillus ponti TaxID=2961894 RepID=A0AA42BNN6_9BACI|nr:2-succinyl-6-hydroxy-2,4-cyclohexadiene-1-carboxylate synthase [Ectobacillus ponti]MCP8967586.1 2-succinyl-6-hydroxy-2,4-cyclohexadiene-1-carboxylate synthase [Ectobacillus ponti]
MKRLIRGVQYEYEVCGSGEALLLLHGFTGSKEAWRRFSASWSRSYQVIMPDLLGHGGTDSPAAAERYDIGQAAADLAALLDHLGIKRVHVLGYSMGGRLAIVFSAIYPDRVASLILENCTAGLEAEADRQNRRQQDEQLAAFLEQQGIAAFVDKWEQVPLFASQEQLPQEQREQIRKQRLQNNPAGLAGSLHGMGTGAQPSYWAALPDFRMPVLLISGEYDIKFQGILARMQKQLPQARLVQVSGAGHAIHVEQPEKFDTIVSEFLQTL